MLRRVTPTLFAVCLLALPFAAAQGAMTGGGGAPLAGGITVSATGTAYGEPDEASFNAGVSALNADVQAATDEVNARVSSLMEALAEGGVAEEDVRTSSFTIYPEQSYDNQGQPRETRYRVTNTLHVTVRDSAQLGALLGASVEAGANEVSSVVYDFADRAALERQAREQAMAQARDKATQLASFGDAQLGAVQRIVEGIQPDGVVPFGGARIEAFAMDAGAQVPVSSGQLAVTVSLHVTFGINQ